MSGRDGSTAAVVATSDPGMALLRALIAAAPVGSGIDLHEMTSTGWASATFVGARHTLRFEANDRAVVDQWLGELPDAHFTLAGHLLVDLVIASVVRRGGVATIELEALTIEAA